MQINANDQFPELNERLTSIYQKLDGDLTPLTRAVGSLLEGSTRQRFADKKAPDGTSWAALLPNTLAKKTTKTVRKKGVSVRGGILVEYGDLMRSITYHASAASVAIGTDRLYGKYHQDGTKYMPSRKFLGLSDTDKANILDLMNEFTAEVING